LQKGKRMGARIVQFNPDGAAIDIVSALPKGFSSMPSAPILTDQLKDFSIIGNKIMGGYLMLRGTQPLQSNLRPAHGGVM